MQLTLVTAMMAILLLNVVIGIPLPNMPANTQPTPSVAIPSQPPYNDNKKVKVAHTRLPSVGFLS